VEGVFAETVDATVARPPEMRVAVAARVKNRWPKGEEEVRTRRHELRALDVAIVVARDEVESLIDAHTYV
jgi:hypothetical protein